MAQVFLPWSPDLLGYDFGPGHPMAPVRMRLAHQLLTDLGVLDRPEVIQAPPVPADEHLLAAVHDADYIRAVQAAAGGRPDPERGLGRSEEHTSELQSRGHLVCRLLLEKKNTIIE